MRYEDNYHILMSDISNSAPADKLTNKGTNMVFSNVTDENTLSVDQCEFEKSGGFLEFIDKYQTFYKKTPTCLYVPEWLHYVLNDAPSNAIEEMMQFIFGHKFWIIENSKNMLVLSDRVR